VSVPIPHDHPLAVELVGAIHTGDRVALEALATQHRFADVLIVDAHGTHKTLVHCAADWPGHFPNVAETIGFLVGQGIPVDAPAFHPSKPDGPRETALHWAASSDDVLALDALLDAGANLEVPGAVFTNGTALSDAVIFRQATCAKRLVERGAVVTSWQAAALGLRDVLESALPRLTSAEKDAALWHAARNGRQDMATLLVEAGADAHTVGPMEWTAVQAAEDANVPALVRFLRESEPRG
jgi:ankyrin repeat protein